MGEEQMKSNENKHIGPHLHEKDKHINIYGRPGLAKVARKCYESFSLLQA